MEEGVLVDGGGVVGMREALQIISLLSPFDYLIPRHNADPHPDSTIKKKWPQYYRSIFIRQRERGTATVMQFLCCF